MDGVAFRKLPKLIGLFSSWILAPSNENLGMGRLETSWHRLPKSGTGGSKFGCEVGGEPMLGTGLASMEDDSAPVRAYFSIHAVSELLEVLLLWWWFVAPFKLRFLPRRVVCVPAWDLLLRRPWVRDRSRSFLAITTCQWFLTALSVRPGKRRAIIAHLFPWNRWAARSLSSSSSVNGRRLMRGSNWLNQRNLQLFPGTHIPQNLKIIRNDDDDDEHSSTSTLNPNCKLQHD